MSPTSPNSDSNPTHLTDREQRIVLLLCRIESPALRSALIKEIGPLCGENQLLKEHSERISAQLQNVVPDINLGIGALKFELSCVSRERDHYLALLEKHGISPE